jgi:hypothetical protein
MKTMVIAILVFSCASSAAAAAGVDEGDVRACLEDSTDVKGLLDSIEKCRQVRTRLKVEPLTSAGTALPPGRLSSTDSRAGIF